MSNDDTITRPPKPKLAPRRSLDKRPFLIVSFRDERWRSCCHACGQRLIDQGLGKQFAHADPEIDRRETFRVIMLALEVSFEDCGHIH